MNKEKDYLKRWGFQKKDWEKPLDTLGLSQAQLDHLMAYYKNFPEVDGLVFHGHPRTVAQVSTRLIKEIFSSDKVSNRITLIDVPSVLLQFSSSSFEARSTQETELLGDLNNSDLIVFQEIALAQWTEAQQARLYILLQQRYAKGLPFFCTVSCDEETFETHVGQSNFFRISDHCTFIELK